MAVINEQVPYFDFDGLSCAESTLRCLIERGVIDAPMHTVRMLTGLHGGALGPGGYCGAINGGVAALGWVLGRTEPTQDSKRLQRVEREFVDAFHEKFGEYTCEALLTEDEASRSQLERCADQVVWAVETVTRILERERAS